MINADSILIEVCDENGIYVDSISNIDWILLEDKLIRSMDTVLEKKKELFKKLALELMSDVKFKRKLGFKGEQGK